MSSPTIELPPDLPRLSPGLIIREDSMPGTYVVKDLDSGKFFHVGEEEHYLFSQLDGHSDHIKIRSSFEARFEAPLSEKDLQDFVDLASRRGLLDGPDLSPELKPNGKPSSKPNKRKHSAKKQTWLNWRIPFLDPDQILNWLEPKLRFIWTRSFVVLTLGLIVFATAVAYANRAHWISAFPEAITWKTIALVWGLIFLVTLIHEFAHGLTCKHYGGEVHEIGFLALFFMPCFYCNVSDAWLFRERRKRLWVGAAGAYCDLVIWALATLLWRVSAPESSLNYFAWMAATICGGRCFLNFNPLIKLDGYYLLSDATRLPNLFDRGRKRFVQTVRYLLWGARRPKPETQGRFLFYYGMASWLFIATILWGMVYGLLQLQSLGSAGLGLVGIVFAVLMPLVIGKNLLRGFSAGEFTKMLKKRRGRALVWLLAILGIPAVTCLVPLQDRVSGNFAVRPSTRIEINALEAGFLKNIVVSEGSRVEAGAVIAHIEIPDLEMNLTKKHAEIRESKANLRRLQVGPRPEEVAEQRSRVERVVNWVKLGNQDLNSAQRAYEEEIIQIEHEILQHEAEVEFGELSLSHSEKLHMQEALSGEQLLSEKTKLRISTLKHDFAQAKLRSREAKGTIEAESELARREKELADERSKLTLLEAGGRPEEAEAESARLARLNEELKYLQHLKSRVVLRSPVDGIVTTPHMHELNGKHVPTGTVVCVVEDLTDLATEIAISESDVLKVEPGQLVELRARSMPMRTFKTEVLRTAPAAKLSTAPTASGAPTVPNAVVPGKVVVYCKLNQEDAQLLSGMTGYARIYGKERSVGGITLDRARRYLRTEFWWW
ncbi:efflux RND transporter periplasmic adaptor subunit [Adhaeretor mobilis]|uniref:Type I secretion system membrane fusion protein PrsE n=1 Tax=Adhaeretor mobilis TaxID=1930276 RepID=A0A517MVI0_9BACT|nr:efflux RND transporter periplasmic adaptor subunit [Adhaeretor mobilis]QDS98882.1 Type I secretion system membrane fusion protein PrsE [Adhaeretor mobilis]